MWLLDNVQTDILVALIGNSVVSRPQGSRGWVKWGSVPDFSSVILDVSKNAFTVWGIGPMGLSCQNCCQTIGEGPQNVLHTNPFLSAISIALGPQ